MTAFPKPSKAARKSARTARLLERRLTVGQLRNAAIARAQGRCEAPDCRRGGVALEMDHVFGGLGRRRQMEALETVMMLCVDCHRMKTTNTPNAATWKDIYRRFCEHHNYPAPVLHMERALHHR